MAKIDAAYDYSTNRTEKYVEFRIRGTKLGCATILAALLLCLVLFFFASAFVRSFAPLVLSPFVALLIIYFINMRRSAEIVLTVSKDSLKLEKRGEIKEFDRLHINRIIIQNSAEKKLGRSVDVSGGRSLTVAASGIGGITAAGFLVASNSAQKIGKGFADASRAEQIKKGWSIQILFGSKKVVLVSHLREETATALYDDICRAFAAN